MMMMILFPCSANFHEPFFRAMLDAATGRRRKWGFVWLADALDPDSGGGGGRRPVGATRVTRQYPSGQCSARPVLDSWSGN